MIEMFAVKFGCERGHVNKLQVVYLQKGCEINHKGLAQSAACKIKDLSLPSRFRGYQRYAHLLDERFLSLVGFL